MTEPSDDDPTVEMDGDEVARLRSLHVPGLDDADPGAADSVPPPGAWEPLMCVTCCGVVGLTCSCPDAEVP